MKKIKFTVPERQEFKEAILTDISVIELNKWKSLYNHFAPSNYKYTEYNTPVITELIKYFNGYKSVFELHKGVMLIGKYGCGKTTIFDIFKECFMHIGWHANNYKVTSVEQIIEDYKSTNSLDKWTFQNVIQYQKQVPKPCHLVVNEFGIKKNIKHYGVDVNEIMSEFWKIRYEIFQRFGKKTHGTTNYNPSEIQETDLIKDRFKELFNMRTLQGSSYRK